MISSTSSFKLRCSHSGLATAAVILLVNATGSDAYTSYNERTEQAAPAPKQLWSENGHQRLAHGWQSSMMKMTELQNEAMFHALVDSFTEIKPPIFLI
jgi:hypothetical protein